MKDEKASEERAAHVTAPGSECEARQRGQDPPLMPKLPRDIKRRLVLAAACLCAPAWAQPEAGSFEVTKSRGLVTQVKVHLVEPGKVLVLDRFTDNEELVANEKSEFSKSSRQDRGCQKFSSPQACERSCYWASKARPFGRARLQDAASGRTLWRWQAGKDESWLGLLSPFEPQAPGGSCLSPDGKYLATVSYSPAANVPDGAATLVGFGVKKVAGKFEHAEFTGQKTHEPFGHKRFTDFVAWKVGRPHTLVFNVMRPENDNQVIVDEGAPK
jgi:hypothetical protein